MPNPNEDINALGYFLASSPNLPLRQKLALAMMARNKKFPTNLGEGIASIGQEIGDTLAYRSVLDEDRAALQSALTAKVPPPPDGAAQPTASPQATVTPPQAAVARDNGPVIVPAQPQQASVIRPPRPPPAPIPPQDGTLGNRGDTVFPTPNNGLVQPQQELPPPAPQAALPPPTAAPVMAQGGSPAAVPPDEENRRAVAHALLRQQLGGAPPPAPAGAPPAPAGEPPRPSVGDYGQPSVLAATPPQAIPAAPPATPIRAAPPPGAAQPEPVAGYVPPEAGRPQGAPTIRPGPQEQQLQALSAANAGNPHWPLSQPAQVLQALVTERERKQKEADKVFEAELSRGNKQSELNITGRMTQRERIDAAEKARLENAALPTRLAQEAAKRQQELVGEVGGAGEPDPYIGTPRSRQRTGVPEIDPMPKGGIPEVHVKEQMKKIEADRTGLESAKPELRETLDLMNKVRAHPMKEASLGTAGGLARLTAEGQGFAKLHDQLIGKNLVAAYQKIKGTGPVGEREGENIAKAQSALNTATSQKDYDDALNTLETTLRGAVERAERKMKQPVTAYQKTPDDPYAPDLHQIGTRGGRKVEYIGGDPSKDSSYKTVR